MVRAPLHTGGPGLRGREQLRPWPTGFHGCTTYHTPEKAEWCCSCPLRGAQPDLARSCEGGWTRISSSGPSPVPSVQCDLEKVTHIFLVLNFPSSKRPAEHLPPPCPLERSEDQAGRLDGTTATSQLGVCLASLQRRREAWGRRGDKGEISQTHQSISSERSRSAGT